MKTLGMVLFVLLEVLFMRSSYVTKLQSFRNIITTRKVHNNSLHSRLVELKVYNTNNVLACIIAYDRFKKSFSI